MGESKSVSRRVVSEQASNLESASAFRQYSERTKRQPSRNSKISQSILNVKKLRVTLLYMSSSSSAYRSRVQSLSAELIRALA